MNKTFQVLLETQVEVEIDETKFDEKFLKEFSEVYYNFITTIDDHLEHLAQLYVRGLADNYSFIEGYGDTSDMGIRFHTNSEDFESWVVP